MPQLVCSSPGCSENAVVKRVVDEALLCASCFTERFEQVLVSEVFVRFLVHRAVNGVLLNDSIKSLKGKSHKVVLTNVGNPLSSLYLLSSIATKRKRFNKRNMYIGFEYSSLNLFSFSCANKICDKYSNFRFGHYLAIILFFNAYLDLFSSIEPKYRRIQTSDKIKIEVTKAICGE
ncbi:30S ribosomal protein S8 domain protein [Dictyocaulus viviparus]|uniref:30S ribosomal protein S8 domain protein n=1 Tax=Dictyocaulus viviparus TaxID=29172 RepID=A0A0D8YA34_DICVI|nr:30S ribosomal protein S8 domain protein [Dictyocaulus viviparus]